MNQLNSSISSSEPTVIPRIGNAMRICGWIVIGLATIDVLINAGLSYPTDPKATNPSRLQIYFEYGRSTEAKLARMTRADRSQTAPITLAGWYDPLQVEEAAAAPQTPTVTFYGMSHAVRLAHALRRVSDRFNPRVVAAPGATANWAYGAYLRDRGGGKSRVAVLAFMSATLPMITSMSPTTWNIDFPMPYTADRFYAEGDDLRVVHPPFSSFEQYVETFNDPARWSAYLDALSKNDPMYNSVIMRASFLDHSSLVRLVRRAYGQRVLRNARNAVLDQTGYRPNSEEIRVARAIVHDFAVQARRDGVTPVIFIVNNLGYSDFLFQALSPTLTTDRIPYLSSHFIVSSSDPRGYLPDSHFTDEVDEKLARELVKLLENLK